MLQVETFGKVESTAYTAYLTEHKISQSQMSIVCPFPSGQSKDIGVCQLFLSTQSIYSRKKESSGERISRPVF